MKRYIPALIAFLLPVSASAMTAEEAEAIGHDFAIVSMIAMGCNANVTDTAEFKQSIQIANRKHPGAFEAGAREGLVFVRVRSDRVCSMVPALKRAGIIQ